MTAKLTKKQAAVLDLAKTNGFVTPYNADWNRSFEQNQLTLENMVDKGALRRVITNQRGLHYVAANA